VLDRSESDRLRRDGFCFSSNLISGAHASHDGAREFVASWDHLALDPYVTNPYQFRFRRFESFKYLPQVGNGLERMPAEPFVQSREVNPLYGGMARFFVTLADHVRAHPLLNEVIRTDLDIFLASSDISTAAWKVGVHQIRIEARAGLAVSPTPEGVHRDGHDFVATHLIRRHDCAGAESVVYDQQKRELGRRTLMSEFDSLLIHDSKVLHFVTDLRSVEHSDLGWRDVLVITFDQFND
jgi:hypothetical protein